MANLATALKEEISRLARKELRSNVGALKKANAQYRRDIAALKRESSELRRRIAFLERQERSRASESAPEALAEGKRFSRKGLATHRRTLGLSAADYAELVGVSAQTIYNWERGKSRPREAQLAALVAVRDLGKRDAQQRLELLRA